MSHYTVMVIQDDYSPSIEEMLEPYYEGLKVPHVITKEEIISKVRNGIKRYEETTYADYIHDPVSYKEKYGSNESHFKYVSEEFPKKLQWSDEECYEDGIKYYDEEQIRQDGSIFSTYNPNSKWDWYDVGGRWGGILPLKSGGEYETANSATIGELDIEKMHDFSTYAVIETNGEWIAPGEMGWFGCSSETDDEMKRWNDEFVNRFIMGRDKDILLTIIDCHI